MSDMHSTCFLMLISDQDSKFQNSKFFPPFLGEFVHGALLKVEHEMNTRVYKYNSLLRKASSFCTFRSKQITIKNKKGTL